jgi:hypothetical protein
MGKMKLPFIESDLLYRGALSGRVKSNKLIMFLTKYILFVPIVNQHGCHHRNKK